MATATVQVSLLAVMAEIVSTYRRAILNGDGWWYVSVWDDGGICSGCAVSPSIAADGSETQVWTAYARDLPYEGIGELEVQYFVEDKGIDADDYDSEELERLTLAHYGYDSQLDAYMDTDDWAIELEECEEAVREILGPDPSNPDKASKFEMVD